MVGNFIYNLGETQKDFILDVNEKFVGCVAYLFTDEKRSKAERKEIFGRGYFGYPSSILPFTRDYSTSAYLLTEFLIRDSGNSKIKQKGLKSVRYDVDRFVKEMQITHSRVSRRYQEFLKAVEEVEIIKTVSPSIAELKGVSPSKGMKTQMTICIPKNLSVFDLEVKARLEGSKK